LFMHRPKRMQGEAMTVYMPPNLAEFTTQMFGVRCKLSLDLTNWGIDVEQRVGPKLWDGYTGPIPSPLRWSFWRTVANHHEIRVPNIYVDSSSYNKSLLSEAVRMRLHDDSFGRLYRIHHGAKLIYDEFLRVLGSRQEGL
jgi:hypothetical protein